MRKTTLSLLGAALVAVVTVQFAAAAERHQGQKAKATTAPATEQFRNSNAAWPTQPEGPRYSGGYSAPAGR